MNFETVSVSCGNWPVM